MSPKKSWFRNLSLAAVVCILVAISSVLISGQTASSPATGVPEDWSFRHLIFSNPGTAEEATAAGRLEQYNNIVNDPRYKFQQLKRNGGVEGSVATGATSTAATSATSTATTSAVKSASKPSKNPPPPTKPKPEGGAWAMNAAPVGVPASASNSFTAESTSGSLVINGLGSTLTISTLFSTSASCTYTAGAATATFARSGTSPYGVNLLAQVIALPSCGGVVGVTATSSGTSFTISALNPGSAGNQVALTSTFNHESTTWTSTSLGTGVFGAAGVGLGRYPAKYSFSTGTTAYCDSDPTPDYAVYNTGLAGSGSQATVIAYDNLYTGCSTSSVPIPNVYWAYNTGSGSVVTSPVISGDGTKVAIIETPASGAATLRIIQWNPGDGSDYSTPVAPANSISNTYYGAGGNGAWNSSSCSVAGSCMISVTFQADLNPDFTSSPYYDYSTDTLYVGDNSGYLHKFAGVFEGTSAGTGPGECTSSNAAGPCAGTWPALVTSGAAAASSPVYDSVSGYVYIGPASASGNGELAEVLATTGAVTFSGELATGATQIFDSPIVDSSSEEVYVFVNDSSATPHDASVYQLPAPFASASTGARQELGQGATYGYAHTGAFDNIYYDTPGSGHLYVCGRASGSQIPTLYRIPITGAGNTTMGTPLTGPALATGATDCSPLTEFDNGTDDFLFLSVQGNNQTTTPISCGVGSGCLMSFNITSPTFTISFGPEYVAVETGGTSALIIDNIAANVTGSQIYFTPLLTAMTCPGNTNTAGASPTSTLEGDISATDTGANNSTTLSAPIGASSTATTLYGAIAASSTSTTLDGPINSTDTGANNTTTLSAPIAASSTSTTLSGAIGSGTTGAQTTTLEGNLGTSSTATTLIGAIGTGTTGAQTTTLEGSLGTSSTATTLIGAIGTGTTGAQTTTLEGSLGTSSTATTLIGAIGTGTTGNQTTNLIGPIAASSATTTTSSNITTTSQTTFTVSSGTNIVHDGYIQIGSEIMEVTSTTGSTSLTVSRAQLGTTASTYTSPATVSFPVIVASNTNVVTGGYILVGTELMLVGTSGRVGAQNTDYTLTVTRGQLSTAPAAQSSGTSNVTIEVLVNGASNAAVANGGYIYVNNTELMEVTANSTVSGASATSVTVTRAQQNTTATAQSGGQSVTFPVMVLTSTDSSVTNGYILIGTELMQVTATPTTFSTWDGLTVSRTQLGTTNATHASSATVTFELLVNGGSNAAVANGGYIYVNSTELMAVTANSTVSGASATSVTVTRAQQNTTATAQSGGQSVTFPVMVLTSTNNSVTNGYILIGTELMQVTAAATAFYTWSGLTVSRTQLGTTNATHASSATVTFELLVNGGSNAAVANGGYIYVNGHELMAVTANSTVSGASATSVTVTRAQQNTTATAQSGGQSVAFPVMVLTSTNNSVTNGYILIGSELMQVTAAPTAFSTWSGLTVSRGACSTTAAAHSTTPGTVTFEFLVASGASYELDGYILVGSELMETTAESTVGSVASLTVTRGAFTTTPAAQSSGVTVSYPLLVASASNVAVNDYIQVGSELMLITASATEGTANALTVTRTEFGTTGAAASSGATVYFPVLLASGTSVASNGYFLVGTELMEVTASSTVGTVTSVTVTRGAFGTTKSTYSDGATVSFPVLVASGTNYVANGYILVGSELMETTASNTYGTANALTVTRAQDGTSAAAASSGDPVSFPVLVASGTNVETNGYILIGSELMEVTATAGTGGTALTVNRGAFDTTSASASSATPVSFPVLVASTPSSFTNGYILVGTELMEVTATPAPIGSPSVYSLTVSRGVLGTTAATQLQSATVTYEGGCATQLSQAGLD